MEDKYKGIKLPALRKIAEEKELKDYEDLERNDLIKILKCSDKELEKKSGEEEEDKKSEEKEEKEEEEEDKKEEEEDEGIKEKSKSPIITGVSIEKYPKESKAEAMKNNLDKQSKISILIPLEGDKVGSTFPVTLNGLRLNILKGTYVAVPKQVAEIIMESQNQTREALEGPMRKGGSPMKLDGVFGPLER